MWSEGLPWWSSGWEFACQCRGHGFDTWSGRIPHVTGQLSPSTAAVRPRVTTTQAHVPRARAPQETPLQGEAFTPQPESGPCSSIATGKSLWNNEDPAQLKINKIFFKVRVMDVYKKKIKIIIWNFCLQRQYAPDNSYTIFCLQHSLTMRRHRSLGVNAIAIDSELFLSNTMITTSSPFNVKLNL